MTLLSRTIKLHAAPDLAAILASLGAFVWVREGDGFVGWGAAARLDPGTGSGRFARACEAVEAMFARATIEDDVRVPGSGPVAFASFTFDQESAGSRVVVPAVSVFRAGDEAWLTMTGDPAEVETATALAESSAGWESIPEPRWMHAVARVRDQIRGGWLEKVVLAREVTVRTDRPFDLRLVTRALARTYPTCFTFCFDGLVGASPELLIRRTGSSIESLVLAGSAPRGRDGAEDEALGARLLASDKERSEHDLALATVRDVLSPACADVKVDDEPSLVRLANVQHLGTRVAGELAGSETAMELAGRLHPTAAVCGVPTHDAMALIRSLEGFDRGRYAGPIGWMDAQGDGEFAIALRCAEISGETARLFAGAGIVAGSDPESELAETALKLRAVQSAMGLTRDEERAPVRGPFDR